MVIWKKIKKWPRTQFFYSTIALWMGWLVFISGITQRIQIARPQGDNLFLGVVMLLGIYAYRSQKRRKLGIKANSKLRQILEISALLFVIILTLFPQNVIYIMLQNPVSRLTAPIWILVAYLVVWKRKYSRISLHNGKSETVRTEAENG
jgi:hypothetical protein